MSTPYGTVVPTASEFVSRYSHASAVLGDWVYIDGGELQYNIEGGSSNPKFELLNLTLVLDLTTAWTNDSVAFKSIPRGGTPLLNSASLWPNAAGNAAYNYGGQISYAVASPNTTQAQAGTLWELSADNQGGGKWTQQNPSAGFPSSIVPATGLSTSGNGLGFYLGGALTYETYPQMPYGIQRGLTGMIQFNSSTGAWQNLSSTAVSGAGNDALAGQAAYGGSHFVPNFGPEGIAVFFGYTPPLTAPQLNVSTQTAQSQINSVSIFEPVSQTWFNQTTGGDTIPQWRGNFCTAGVAGDNGTYEIIMHGGTQYVEGGSLDSKYADEWGQLSVNEQELDQIYILSLPSFTWFRSWYTPIASRSSHTCHTVGSGRQLLTIGGINFNTTYVPGKANTSDAFAQGLGIFDLTDGQWMSSYDPNAANYVTPSIIKSYIASAGPTPTSWTDPKLAQVFATSRAAASSSPPSSSASATPKSSSSSTGAIVGGVVGGVVGFLLLLGLGLFFLLRHRRRRQPHAREQIPSPDDTQDPSLEGAQDSQPDSSQYPIQYNKLELAADERRELPADEVRHEVEADGHRAHAHEMSDTSKPAELYTPSVNSKPVELYAPVNFRE